MKFIGLNDAIRSAGQKLRVADEVPVKRWQGVATEGHFKEVVNFSFEAPIPHNIEDLQKRVKPSLPWAEDHFQERVAGVPSNPGEEYKNWPFWTPDAEETMRRVGGKFSHTYMERFWPKEAGANGSAVGWAPGTRVGIRYPYGDLSDVVYLLLEDPYTRQAYLPIFFPEDTGAVHQERVPCSLGYHFMLRDRKLHCWYFIRSVDFVHYLRDDIYMACRLCQWVLDEVHNRANESDYALGEESPYNWPMGVVPGNLYMTICSLHVFSKDFEVVRRLTGVH